MSVKNIEQGRTDPRVSTLTALRTALEAAGIIFLADGELVEGGPGVRLRAEEKAPQSPQPDSDAGIIETSEM